MTLRRIGWWNVKMRANQADGWMCVCISCSYTWFFFVKSNLFFDCWLQLVNGKWVQLEFLDSMVEPKKEHQTSPPTSCIWVFPKIVGFPQIIHLFIGFSMIFTIHFGVYTPIVGNPHISLLNFREIKTGRLLLLFYALLFPRVVRCHCLRSALLTSHSDHKAFCKGYQVRQKQMGSSWGDWLAHGFCTFFF